MSIINALPNTLTNGTTADATQVMADLNQIVNNVNSNAAENGANSSITSLSGLLTPLSIAQGGTGSGTGSLSSAFTGVTQSSGDSSTKLATTAFVYTSVSNVQTGKNRAVNGAMQISQVNGGTAVTPATSGTWPIDQFQAINTQASKLTFQQVADAPAGFKYSTKISVAAQYAPLATDQFAFAQNIEGQNLIDFQLGTAGAVTIATGQYIKGSVAGTYAVSVRNGAANRSYVGTINVTTSWAPAVITLVGDTTGTWSTDTTTGLTWAIDLGSGSNFNTTAGSWQAGNFTRTAGSVSFVNQIVGSTLNITGLQIEKVPAGATQGTAFEFKTYAEDLVKCQRYLPNYSANGVLSSICPGWAGATTQGVGLIPLKVLTRIPVTGLVVSGGNPISLSTTAAYVISALAISAPSTDSILIYGTIAGATAGQAGSLIWNNTGGQLYFTGAQL